MSSNENQKMEKGALKVFLSLAGVIYAYGLWYSFSSGNNLAGGLLIAVIVLLSLMVLWTGRSKT